MTRPRPRPRSMPEARSRLPYELALHALDEQERHVSELRGCLAQGAGIAGSRRRVHRATQRGPEIGWSTTSVPAATAAYAAQVEQLRHAIVHVRESERVRTTAPGRPDGDDRDDGLAEGRGDFGDGCACGRRRAGGRP